MQHLYAQLEGFKEMKQVIKIMGILSIILDKHEIKRSMRLYEIRWLWNFRKRYGNYGAIL